MPKVTFEDRYHRTSILGDVADIPTPEWLALQEKQPPPTGGIWYHAYPLGGGATVIHESDIKNKRPTTFDDLATLVGCNNPATTTVLTMFGLSD